MLLLRDPLNDHHFLGKWSSSSEKWTEELKASIPYGFTPDSSLILEADEFTYCFSRFQIGHYRPGYSDTWFDQDNDDGIVKSYLFKAIGQGDLYFTVETYYQGMVPFECQSALPLAKMQIY